MNDLDFYAWREPVEVDGTPRLLVPLSDPMVHEVAADGVFATVADAVEYLDLYGWEDLAAAGGWVLVRYRGEIVTHGPTPGPGAAGPA